MGWLKFLTVVLLPSWGAAVFASTTDSRGAVQELQTISSWMSHLNHHYPDIQVGTLKDLRNSEERKLTLEELELLEEHLQGQIELPQSSLIHIACRNIICGD